VIVVLVKSRGKPERAAGSTFDVAAPQEFLVRARPEVRALRLLAGEVGCGRLALQILGPKRTIASRRRKLDVGVRPRATGEGVAPPLEAVSHGHDG
jgi:hypothetical protein